MTNTNAIIIEGVSKTFKAKPKPIRAVDDVSLSIRQGEIFGLLGPNGAGKTTLISILCGLLEKDQGTVQILGYDIDTQLRAIKREINLVQGFSGIGLKLTVREFLRYSCMLYNLNDVDTRIAVVIKRCGLEGREDHIALDLSSGFKQRLIIARSLLNKPKLLILDEPTVGLDVEIAIRVRELIKELRTDGVTILLTTHNMYEVEELCDRIALINYGRIIAIGTVAQIKKLVPARASVEIVADNPVAVVKALRQHGYSKALRIEEATIYLDLPSRTHMRPLLAHLAKTGLDMSSVRLAEPTLEEAFIKITRHSPSTKKSDKNRTPRRSHVA